MGSPCIHTHTFMYIQTQKKRDREKEADTQKGRIIVDIIRPAVV